MKILFFIMWVIGLMLYVMWYLDCRDFGVKHPKWLVSIMIVLFTLMVCLGEAF